MGDKLKGKRIAILAADMFEQVELMEPRKALEAEGAETEIVSIHDGEIQGFNHFDPADKLPVDKTAEEASADDYDALLVPGGVGNPDQLRGDENAVNLVRDFARQGKPMAVICHGPWVLVEAGVVRGRTLTSWPTLRTDIVNAGGNWVDQQVVVDEGIVTSRKPDDIPAFNRKMVELFAAGPRRGRQVAEAGARTTSLRAALSRRPGAAPSRAAPGRLPPVLCRRSRTAILCRARWR